MMTAGALESTPPLCRDVCEWFAEGARSDDWRMARAYLYGAMRAAHGTNLISLWCELQDLYRLAATREQMQRGAP